MLQPRFLLPLCLSIPLLLADPLRAESANPSLFSMPLEELMQLKVVTASKRAEPIDAAPNVMYVITRDQIRNRGYRTLKEALQTIPGFAVFFRDLQYVMQVRGIAPNENEKITFMIDGHVVNQVAEPEILMGPLHLDLVERIEVIVGPGSVLYGANTLAAIVNIIPRREAGTEVGIAIGSADAYKIHARSAKRWSDTRWLSVSAVYMENDGWNAWRRGYRGANIANNTDTGKLNPSNWLLAEAKLDDWLFTFSSYNQKMPELGMRYDGWQAGEAFRYDYIDMFAAENRHQITDNLKGRLGITYADKRMLRTTTQGIGNGFDLNQTSYALDYDLEYKLNAHLIQAGLHGVYAQNRHNYSIYWSPSDPNFANSRIQSFITDEDTTDYGIYLSDTYTISDRLKVVAAIRGDGTTLIEDNRIYPSPRLALVYQTPNRWTSKIMYNRATRFPSPWSTELNQVWSGSDIDTNYFINPPAVDPETIDTIEWQNIFYFSTIRISANVYYQKLRDYIAWFRPFTNAGDFEGFGAELDIQAPVSPTLTLWGNLATTDTDFTQKAASPPVPVMPANPSGEIVAVPKLIINAGADYQIAKQVNSSLVCRYFTGQPAYDSIKQSWFDVDNQFYVDATVRWTQCFDLPLDLRVTVKNIFDQTDEVASQFHSYTYAPRGTTAELSLTYNF